VIEPDGDGIERYGSRDDMSISICSIRWFDRSTASMPVSTAAMRRSSPVSRASTQSNLAPTLKKSFGELCRLQVQPPLAGV
jgi:hypothetical protein